MLKNFNKQVTTPLNSGIKNFSRVAEYFLYYAPNIDSEQSRGKIEGPQADSVLEKMIERAQLKGNNKFIQNPSIGTWKSYKLDDDNLDFEYSRFICQRNKDELKLTALLRHMRNAFAHGRIYVWKKKKKGNFVFLVDKKQKINTKMMLSSKILEDWKAILENEIPTGE